MRIAVNAEFDELSTGVDALLSAMPVGSRIAVMTFHSLEDRVVKNAFRTAKIARRATWLTRKPITPERAECKRNPRSRSAKLRVVENRRTFVAMMSIFTVVFSILYVRSRFLLIELSHHLNRAQREKIVLERDLQSLSLELAQLKSPSRIEGIAREKLGLNRDAKVQIVRFPARGGR